MAESAFIDLNGKDSHVYVFDKSTGRHLRTHDFSDSDTGALSAFDFSSIDDTCLGIPFDLIDFRALALPLGDIESIRKVLPFELDNIILGGAEDKAMDAVLTGRVPDTGNNKVLVAYARRERIRAILDALSLAGLDPRAATSIELGYALNQREVDPVERLTVGRELMDATARIETAWREIVAPSINLRQGSLENKKDALKTRQSLTISAVLIALALITFSADIAYKLVSVRKESAAIEAKTLKTYKELFPEDKAATTAGLDYKVKARLKEIKDKDAAMSGAAPLELMLRLQSKMPQGVTCSAITLDRDSTLIKGEATAISKVQELVAAIGDFLPDARIDETGQNVKDKTSFTIAAKGVVR